jgi:hypothetical protein
MRSLVLRNLCMATSLTSPIHHCTYEVNYMMEHSDTKDDTRFTPGKKRSYVYLPAEFEHLAMLVH